MTANTHTAPASNGSASGTQKKEYFNLNVSGIGYLNSNRRVQGPNSGEQRRINVAPIQTVGARKYTARN
ncbi:DUF3577 domain-containing protein (plasmid) [Serratia symbiotica]|uniref:DUF3577 domain-containing protein n=1 Tax=Serratia symbiotica TaxID=138074 RepID=UPI0020904685|nr:DUF3577 domain-containing protein [Serratia symbiotica]USS96881.1 DUF3577 domain-containing protein [Serratia symbiotica]USS96909.1 DUF3577 domain-containing protein [Serratia symbiotica]